MHVRVILASLALLTSAIACADDEAPTDGGVVDSGSARDTGIDVDSGTVEDSGIVADSGAEVDSGFVTDSGIEPDSGIEEDSGIVPDSGIEPDSGVLPDAGTTVDGGPSDSGVCELGIATSSAAVSNPALFGQVFPFANGANLPAGTYEVSYVDGCFKFQSTQWWTIHARADGFTTWWLVGADSSDRKQYLPGTVGYLPGTATSSVGDQNGYEIFTDCVAANQALPADTYVHSGGPLGIWLADTNYPDNIPGENGRNPAWRLTLLEACPD
jgi:hypothetical protein